MPENPYFEDAGAPPLEQLDNDEKEQNESYGHSVNEHVKAVQKDDENEKIHSEKLRYVNADNIYE